MLMKQKSKSVESARERLAQLKREKAERQESDRLRAESKTQNEEIRMQRVREGLSIITDCFTKSHVRQVCRFWSRHMHVDEHIASGGNVQEDIANLFYNITMASTQLVVELGPSRDGPRNSHECRGVGIFGTALPCIPAAECLTLKAQYLLCDLINPAKKLFNRTVVSNNVAAKYTLDHFKYDVQIDEILDRKSILQVMIYYLIETSLRERTHVFVDHKLSPSIFGTMTVLEISLTMCIKKIIAMYEVSRKTLDTSKTETLRQRAIMIWNMILAKRNFARMCTRNPDIEMNVLSESFSDVADYLCFVDLSST